MNARTAATFQAIGQAGLSLFLALGGLDYGPAWPEMGAQKGSEKAWCNGAKHEVA
ncbi:MAG: hypothetical protein ETSY2_28880 [Candidatus Entotheonella gemina]|uniref:Uncharacterized protein n=1 Tax=Candidatus Entotheonella gemina TaxID=1429439 RepID=W4M470_9BACT|nr:MAG: hypothetical protein ETSY2_28880 [Candidatus Entotheonella gemina]